MGRGIGVARPAEWTGRLKKAMPLVALLVASASLANLPPSAYSGSTDGWPALIYLAWYGFYVFRPLRIASVILFLLVVGLGCSVVYFMPALYYWLFPDLVMFKPPFPDQSHLRILYGGAVMFGVVYFGLIYFRLQLPQWPFYLGAAVYVCTPYLADRVLTVLFGGHWYHYLSVGLGTGFVYPFIGVALGLPLLRYGGDSE